MGNSILILICIAVAVIVVFWLVRFILGIRRTNRVYREVLEKKAGEKNEQMSDPSVHTGDTINHSTTMEQKGNENDQN